MVEPADFYVPHFGRLFAACAALAGVGQGWDSGERIRCAAEAAGVDEAEVAALVNDRGRFHDVHAEYAHRVAAEAERRRLMVAFADAFNALGSGATAEDARRLVERLAA